MQLRCSNIINDARIAFRKCAASRRHDFLAVLRLQEAQSTLNTSASIYAWYRLGCYQSVIKLAKKYRVKNASDIVAISASLAVTGRFEECVSLVEEHLDMLCRQPRLAIEAARGIVKFDPYLSYKIIQNFPGNTDFRAASLLAFGQKNIAREAFQESVRPVRSDVLAGHFFLKANLSDDISVKMEAVNEQLTGFGLSKVHLTNGASAFKLDHLRNEITNFSDDGPLVSIIVPAFNAENTIRLSVSSILEQSYRNFEVIIVDDGSTDNTLSVAYDLARDDPRVRVLDLLQNKGAYAARNAGLKAAVGHFVTVHDVDDFAHAQKIERQVRPLLQNERLMFSISDMVRVSADGTFARRDIYPLQRMNTSSLLFRRELVLRKCGYWEEKRFGADSEYLFRLRNSFRKDRWVRLRLPLSFAADHSDSLTALISTGGFRAPSDPRRIAYTEAYTRRWLQRSGDQSNG
ncbi:glycosyltransferase family 2 protein [Thalassobacter stenotrophicus]|uniref:glycosyltransferase family 2 protein n=1 Tax=Thalassobacter stenotrophicus TaxID=266809 RepID=UPI0009DEF9D9|nr:glycosyltransferase family A protein [Thalassobacter stenotrophicus]